ncbi:MAG: AtpZ/AtpI family protein [Acidobacteria bacterium]|nr:AtpZ/AtpI family protein [Acidobacteriota bacterium]
MSDQNKNPWTLAGEYTTLAIVLPVSTAVGYFMGVGLDRLFGTHFLYIVFLLLGIAAGFVQLIRQIQKDTRG